MARGVETLSVKPANAIVVVVVCDRRAGGGRGRTHGVRAQADVGEVFMWKFLLFFFRA